MRLLVDAGNTAIKWGLYEAGEIVNTGRFVHRGCDIGARLSRFWASLQQPVDVCVASVAGADLDKALSVWTLQQWSLTPRFISTGHVDCGVTNAYPVAENLGVDRWATLIAAHHFYREPTCIIDCGTATTVDLLATNGLHLGGTIYPGIEMLKKMIREDTAGVLSAEDVPLVTLFANGTDAGIHSGAVYMLVATIDRVLVDMAATQDRDFKVVITGGDATRVLTLLARPVHHEPDLVLKGLAILAGEN